MVRSSLEQVLDACVAQLNSGKDLEKVLAAYPQDADELRPMLVAAALVRIDVPPPVHKMARKSAFLDSVADRRRQVEMTEGYVVEMKAGVPLLDLLERATPALKPTIQAAWRMFKTPAPVPSPDTMASGKLRLMAMAEERRAARRVAAPGIVARARRTMIGVQIGLRPRPTATRRAWSGAVALMLTAIALSMGAAGVGTVAASSLPGDSLYEVKELGRSAKMAFAFDPAARAELQLRIGSERLAEIEALARTGRMVPADALEAWLRGQLMAVSDIQRLPNEQRRELYELLLWSVDRPDLESKLRSAVDDPAALADLLARSDTLLRRAQVSMGTEPATPEAQGKDEFVEPVVPVVQRESQSRSERQVADDAGSGAPAAPLPVAPEVVAPASVEAPPRSQSEEPQYVQVGDDEGKSGDRAAGASGQPASATATQPTATATAQPAYNQPIFEEPTDTPAPLPQEPTALAPQGEQPVDPPSTPGPGETPVAGP